jgi:hypothetical protein
MFLDIRIKLEIKLVTGEKTTSGWGRYTEGRPQSNQAGRRDREEQVEI